MKEFELIEKLLPSLPQNASVVRGAGDDCAVLDAGWPGLFLLFKTDAVVEGVHFERDANPRLVGHKALARALSDVAAMGGTPTAALITLGLPTGFEFALVRELYAGMSALASSHQVALVGGETTRSPDRLFLSIALLGTVPKTKVPYRSAAKPRDAIFVTGRLGGSRAGRHLEFEPRLNEARWLAERFSLHAMIDLSDGLAGDLGHILKASGVGAELLARAIPISREAREQAKPTAGLGEGARERKTPLLAALTDGEDFELLFTLPPNEAVPLADAWRERFPDLPLSCIGTITERPGLVLREKDGVRVLPSHGYDHFA